MKSVEINGDEINDWDSFHDLFMAKFGFPGFYGRNMNAWIDCMSYINDDDAEMTSIHADRHELITLVISSSESLRKRCPEIFESITDCTAFVNQRFIEDNDQTRILLCLE